MARYISDLSAQADPLDADLMWFQRASDSAPRKITIGELKTEFGVGTAIADGTTTNNTLRWGGSAWVESDKLQIVTAGIDVRGSLSNDPATGGVQDTQLNFENSGGTEIGDILWNGGANMLFRNLVHGGLITLQGQDDGGSTQNLILADPDNAVTSHYAGTARLATTSVGADVFGPMLFVDNTGASASVNLRLINSEGGLQLRANDDGFQLQQLDAAGVEEDLWITGDNNGRVAFRFNGLIRAATLVDGFSVGHSGANNDETILTLASERTWAFRATDSGSSTGLDLFSTVAGKQLRILETGGNISAIFAPAGTVRLYSGGAQKFATNSTGIDVFGSIIDLDFSTSTGAARLYIRNSEGGIEMRADADQFNIYQTTSGSSVEDTWITCANNARVGLFYNGVEELQTQNSDGSHNTSGAAVTDHGGNFRDVGFNVMPIAERDTSQTLNEIHSSRMMHRDGTGSLTYTLASGTSGTIPPVGAVIMISNENATGTVTISAAGTLRFWEGTGTPGTGNRTLAHGGVCSVYHYSDTEWWIWGIGVA